MSQKALRRLVASSQHPDFEWISWDSLAEGGDGGPLDHFPSALALLFRLEQTLAEADDTISHYDLCTKETLLERLEQCRIPLHLICRGLRAQLKARGYDASEPPRNNRGKS